MWRQQSWESNIGATMGSSRRANARVLALALERTEHGRFEIKRRSDAELDPARGRHE